MKRTSHDPTLVAEAESSAKHHPQGPSALGYLSQCRHFVRRKGSGDASLRGSLLHKAVELMDPSALDEDESKLYEYAVEFRSMIVRSADAVYVETPLTILLPGAGIKDDSIYGTADLIVDRDGTEFSVVDWKFGELAVPAVAENWQAQAYALGVFDQWPRADVVNFYFVLPRREDVIGGTFYRKDAGTLRSRITRLVSEATRKVPPPPQTGPACEYCVFLPSCDAVRQDVVSKVTGLPLPRKAIGAVTHAELGEQLMPAARVVSAWADAVKDEARTRMETGAELPGHRLIERRSIATIVGQEIKELLSDFPSLTLGDINAKTTTSAVRRKLTPTERAKFKTWCEGRDISDSTVNVVMRK